MTSRKKIIIMGAAGRDFHDFNTYFRNNDIYEVVAFTAEQIPDIAGRRYPPELSGKLYPEGIPIHSESELPELIKKHSIDQVVLAYSDLPYQLVMSKSAKIMAAGADFRLLGPKNTEIRATKPVISICAVRTGCGKSQSTRKISLLLRDKGFKVTIIRHPMPYGDLSKQIWQRFETLEDLDIHECTIEEREEYEPHISNGMIVYAGVDYAEILTRAEEDVDIILWDGGNNDFGFYTADLNVVVTDPHRLGHESNYFPGEVVARRADVIIINKADTAPEGSVKQLEKNLKALNPDATIIVANSPVSVNDISIIEGKRVLVVEDGPTLTHGDMAYGAGHIAAEHNKAKEIIDPRPFAVGSIKDTFTKYKHLSDILPAMGYGEKQVKELEEVINKADCDSVVIGTPIDLGSIISINKPNTRVTYELDDDIDVNDSKLSDIIEEFLKEKNLV
ncbi:MAG: cyclic 2,3-diphosphoglycerate synthase [Candidatus Hodarchaeales archaeon]|jgi:predicted GTPase